MPMDTEKIKLIDQRTGMFLTLLLILISNSPFFSVGVLWKFIIMPPVIAYFFLKNNKLGASFLVFLALLSIVLVLQVIKYHVFVTGSFINTLMLFLFAYCVFALTGTSNFMKNFVKIIFVFTIISFIFFIPSIIIPGFESFFVEKIAPVFSRQTRSEFYQYIPNIIIYCFNTNTAGTGFLRNPGPFHEAGGFADFLLIAMVFETLLTKKLFSKRNIIFIIALISTFSTTGYLAFSLLLFAYFITQKSIMQSLLFLPLFGLIVTYYFSNLDFMKDKINEQLKSAETANYDIAGRTRFISAILDFKDVKENPLLGKGTSKLTRFEDYQGDSSLTHRNNGFTDIFVKYGIPFALYFFFNIILTLRTLSEKFEFPPYFGYYIFLILCVLSFSELIFSSSLFSGLAAWHFFINNEQKES
jgi:hypothetical protein